ncbi:MAG: hypothetical protein GEU82_00950 [Luteitalea sp.]|nr:hypothetical protein [Luteitalea sp.]
MVLTKAELLTALQNEVRTLLHLAGKIDRAQLDYRPSPQQRSTIDLLRYLTFMGPALVQAAMTEFDRSSWAAEIQAAAGRDFDESLAVIADQADQYATLLANMSDEDFRTSMTGFDGMATSRGAFIAKMVLGGCAAYRMQLFLYLKACGREDLNTINLWRGVDAPAAV